MFLVLCCVRLGASVSTELLQFVMYFPSMPAKLITRLTFSQKIWVSQLQIKALIPRYCWEKYDFSYCCFYALTLYFC